MIRNTTRSVADQPRYWRSRHFPDAVLAIAIPLLLLISGRIGTATDVRDGLIIPGDPDVVVLELAYQDAGRRTPRTVVSVHADGTVVVSDEDREQELRGRISRGRLRNLIRDVVEDSSVFELDSGRILQDVRAAAVQSGRSWRVENAGVVLLRVRLHNRQHEVRCPAAEIWHERFPAVESVARFCSARRRLENIRAIVQVGGWEKADQLSEVANTELQRAHPDATPVTPDDLSMVRGRLPQPRFVQFLSAPSTSDGETLMISVFEFPNQPVRITIAPLSGS